MSLIMEDIHDLEGVCMVLALVCLMVQDNVLDDDTVLVDDPEAVVGLGGPADALVNS